MMKKKSVTSERVKKVILELQKLVDNWETLSYRQIYSNLEDQENKVCSALSLAADEVWVDAPHDEFPIDPKEMNIPRSVYEKNFK